MTDDKRYTAEETAGNRRLWTEALRSGDYEQGQGQLRRDDDGDVFGPTPLEASQYCCLGVACEIAKKAGVIEFYDPSAATLPIPVALWLGLKTGSGPLKEVVVAHSGGGIREDDSLWELNDHAGYTFEQLADIIDADRVLLATEGASDEGL